MMKEAYVSYKIAKLLKEKGFDEKTKHWYNVKESLINDYPVSYENFFNPEKVWLAPTHQMACAWLREKKDIFIQVNRDNQYYEGYAITPLTKQDKERGHKPEYYAIVYNQVSKTWCTEHFDSYEDAIESALKYTLENLL